MNYILDTNILILLVKSRLFSSFFRENYLKDTENRFSYTHISLGELSSITRKNKWGKPKLIALNQILKGFELIKATSISIINNYGIIDAYSQGKLKDKPLPKGMSARNMGKNDLWIAASSMAQKATLLTTDQDFEHLHNEFIDVVEIDIALFY